MDRDGFRRYLQGRGAGLELVPDLTQEALALRDVLLGLDPLGGAPVDYAEDPAPLLA